MYKGHNVSGFSESVTLFMVFVFNLNPISRWYPFSFIKLRSIQLPFWLNINSAFWSSLSQKVVSLPLPNALWSGTAQETNSINSHAKLHSLPPLSVQTRHFSRSRGRDHGPALLPLCEAGLGFSGGGAGTPDAFISELKRFGAMATPFLPEAGGALVGQSVFQLGPAFQSVWTTEPCLPSTQTLV